MKYIVKTHNDWMHPYFYSAGNTQIIREKNTVEQETDSYDLAIEMVKDWLDVPDHNIDAGDVRNMFDSETKTLDNEHIVQIQNYYNGRLQIFNTFAENFKIAKIGDRLKYNIPYELNHFETEPYEEIYNEKQNDSYFEVIIKE